MGTLPSTCRISETVGTLSLKTSLDMISSSQACCSACLTESASWAETTTMRRCSTCCTGWISTVSTQRQSTSSRLTLDSWLSLRGGEEKAGYVKSTMKHISSTFIYIPVKYGGIEK